MNPETAASVEKYIEELDSFKKFDQFINLSTHYHLNKCTNGNICNRCDFIINLWYLQDEKFINNEATNIEKLQNYCRIKHFRFFSLRVMLHILASI